MLRSRQFTMRCRRFRELCVGQQVRCAKRVVDGGREGLTPLHAAGRGLATCALMARPLIRTRFSSRDARRNLTQAAKSGVRLLFLGSKDRRASKTPRKPVLVNGAACKRPEILRLCPPVLRFGSCSVHAACTRLTWTFTTHLLDYLTEPTHMYRLPASNSNNSALGG